MSERVLKGRVADPSNDRRTLKVTASIVGAVDGKVVEIPAFHAATHTQIVGAVTDRVNSDGDFEWELSLIPTTELAPAGLMYRVVVEDVSVGRRWAKLLDKMVELEPGADPVWIDELVPVESPVAIDYTSLEVPGPSAYEVAVAEGFVGTVEQWLASLKGADGNDGADGSTPPWSAITDKPATFPPDPHTHTQAEVDGLAASLAAKADTSDLAAHAANTANPHAVTKAQVGLGSVDNTPDASKPVSTAQAAADNAVASAAATDATTKANAAQSYAVQRANHTGVQPSTTISDFTEAVQDAVAAMLVSGAGVTLTYNDADGTLTVDGASGGDAETMRDVIGAALVGINGVSVAINDAADTITLSVSGVTIAQVTDLQSTLDGKAALTHTHSASEVSGLSTVATTGAYTDLSGKPTIPTTPADIGAASASSLTAHTGDTANPHAVTKAQVGLGSVDNTSDLAKPVSTATQAALDGKAASTHTHDDRYYTESEVDTLLAAKASATTRTINAQTGTSYTLVLTDAGKFVTMTNAGASTLTVPPNSSVAFPVGTKLEGAQLGAGQVTITAGAGVTVNASPGLKVAAQYGTFGLLKVATDTWLAFGRLSA